MIEETKMKRKFFVVMITVVLITAMFMPASSLGEARYPALRGAVTDDANVLAQSVSSDIAAFQALAFARTGVTVHVAIVHFLDGVDAQTYANTLFARWGLGEKDFLLVGAVGEDGFASASGKELKQKLNDSNAQGLLFTSGFSELFKAQQYDAAFSKYFVAFSDMLGKQFDEDIRLGKLFSDYQAEAQETPKPTENANKWTSFVSEMWGGFNESIGKNVRDYDAYNEQRERESNGLSPSGWVVLALLAILIFGHSDPVRKARGRGGCMGCGCSPLGWIFGAFGLGALFGKRNK